MVLLMALFALVLVTVLDYLAQQKNGVLSYAGDGTATPATAPKSVYTKHNNKQRPSTMNNTTEIFKNYNDFKKRKNKRVNGVSEDFAAANPDYENHNTTNIGCWNCNDCNDCKYCNDCNDCNYCNDCNDCNYCNDCDDCNDCNYCNRCNDCCNCNYCNDCNYCNYCNDCNDCYNCNNCNDCYYCNDCNDRNSSRWVRYQQMQN